jgi:hypothetical protein
MPCYQSTSLPRGFPTTGRTSYKTEAECNQACKEGACCEGTTCTVKPQCQCVCKSGSCCGPDTFTNSNGETGPRCRNESESACAARGGTWRCGVSCVGLQGDQFAGQPLGSGICTSLTGSPSTPVFKGVGTTCAALGVNSGRCCFYNQSKTPYGFYRGVERVTRSYCESRGGTWTAASQCDDGICTADADCNDRTGLSTSDPSLNCGCTQCGTTAPNPLP